MGLFTDLIPAKYRRYIYAVAALAALVYGAWQAAGGNWNVAVTSLLTTLVTALAHGNTNPDSDKSQDGGTS